MSPAKDTSPSSPRVVAQTPRQSASEELVHLSVSEHADRGKAAREAVPRANHAAWAPVAERRNPVDLLEGR